MSLTKKHFISIARIIRNATEDNKNELVDNFIDFFKGENKDFDEVKFKEMCLK